MIVEMKSAKSTFKEALQKLGLNYFDVELYEKTENTQFCRAYAVSLSKALEIKEITEIPSSMEKMLAEIERSVLKSPVVSKLLEDKNIRLADSFVENKKLREKLAKYKAHYNLAFEMAHGKKRM